MVRSLGGERKGPNPHVLVDEVSRDAQTFGPRDHARERQQKELESWANEPHPRDAQITFPSQHAEQGSGEEPGPDMDIGLHPHLGIIS